MQLEIKIADAETTVPKSTVNNIPQHKVTSQLSEIVKERAQTEEQVA